MSDDRADTQPPDSAPPGPSGAPDAAPDATPKATSKAAPPATPKAAPKAAPDAGPRPRTAPTGQAGAWRGMARGFGSVAAVIIVVLLVVLARGGLGRHATTAATTPAAPPGQAALPGLQATPAPWPAEYRYLPQRMAALGLPDLSDTGFHVHAQLRVYVDGLPITVPANIGLPDRGNVVSPLHTHDATGIIHIESTRPYAFTLGQLFDVWGVAFSQTQLGAYRADGPNRLEVYVNGRAVADGPGYVMRAHDTIIVGYGRAGSFPTSQPGDFSGGL